jgi:hypothetical protein
MIKILQNVHPVIFMIIATTFEVSGDALIRKSIYNYSGAARIGLAFIGMIFLFGYGFFLNLAPVEFGKIVGLYIATLFIIWQIVTYFSFGSLPSIPIIVGGFFIVAGGLIITFWKQN